MANVLNFECTDYPKDLIRDIFERQHNLAEKYIPIEQSNGLCLYNKIPADIDDNKAQARIKDMSWRAMEEIAEALEAFVHKETVHFYEELADAFHFLVEKYLLCNFIPIRLGISEFYMGSSPDYENTNLHSFLRSSMPPVDFDNTPFEYGTRYPQLQMAISDYVMASGLTCNCLKNKPWKQSHVLTDVTKFRSLLGEEFKSFMLICSLAGFDEKSLYNMYIRKNQVNKFRQKSNY